MNDSRPGPSGWRRYAFVFLMLVVGVSPGCTATHSLVARDTAEVVFHAAAATPVAWFTPLAKNDDESLARWRSSVGRPIVVERARGEQAADAIRVVSWNTDVGEA